MKKLLIALGVGASLLAVTPAAAKHDDRSHHDQHWDHHDNGNHNGWNRGHGRRWQNNHHRQRYIYYRHGHRYYGWR